MWVWVGVCVEMRVRVCACVHLCVCICVYVVRVCDDACAEGAGELDEGDEDDDAPELPDSEAVRQHMRNGIWGQDAQTGASLSEHSLPPSEEVMVADEDLKMFFGEVRTAAVDILQDVALPYC